MRLLKPALVLGVAVACDGSTVQAPPPLDPPPAESGRGSGGPCAQADIEGASVSRFESKGSCLPGDVLILYRCSPSVAPVLRISSITGPALFLGGAFAVPADTLPSNVRLAGESDDAEILIADPPARSSPAEAVSTGPSPGEGPRLRTEPLVYVRRDRVTERWLRLERRRVHDPPIVWLIGDSILDGGRDAVEAGLSGWSATLDAEVGRPSSSGIALATDAAEHDADVVVMELGTNDSSADEFRENLLESLDALTTIPLVIWQTAGILWEGTSVPAVNEAIREVAPTYPNVAIADWEAFVPDEALQEDGIHPDEGFEHLEAELLLPLLSEWRAAASEEGATSCGRAVVRETA